VELLRDHVVDQLVTIANVEIDLLSSASMDSSSAGASHGICQLALIGLQLLCRLLGENYPDLFISVSWHYFQYVLTGSWHCTAHGV
jgi:hypothetical protein